MRLPRAHGPADARSGPLRSVQSAAATATPLAEAAHRILKARSVVVSLHDVSPRTQAASARILQELTALGVNALSLLVIADHHRRGHFLEDAGFCAWLRELEGAGHEIVIHGYFHERTQRAAESLATRLTTRVYTAGEGEFHDLDRVTAHALVEKAQAEFASAQLHPHGFIAPAWLLSAPAEDALRDLGLDYTTRLGSVKDLRSGAVWRSQSLVWSVRAAWRRAVSRVWNAWLFRRLRDNPLLRVSIHPVDLDHPAIWRQVCALVQRATASRAAATYIRWIDTERIRENGTAL